MARGGVRPGSGRPKGSTSKPTPFKELAQSHAPAAFERVLGLLQSADENVALKAAQTVLDRAYGRPAQAVAGPSGEGPVEAVMTLITGVRRATDG